MKITATALNENLKSLLMVLLGAFILCSIPALAALFNWQWEPGINPVLTRFLSFISLSANAVTALLVIAFIFWRLKPKKRQCLILLSIIVVIFLSSLTIKSKIKRVTEEPRPFAVWLQKTNISAKKYETDSFLAPKRFVNQEALSQAGIPIWQQNYWANSSKYSFPSGHSLFAVMIALLTLSLLYRQKAYFFISITMVWAALVETSRLALGMHWPRDIAASCAIASSLMIVGSLAWNKWVFALPDNPTQLSTASQ